MFEKKIEVRRLNLLETSNGGGAFELDMGTVQQWENGLNALANWELVQVIVIEQWVWAFLQRQT